MNIKRVVGCVVVALATSTAFAAEPTTIAEVNLMALRAAAQTEVSDTCLFALKAELLRAGRTSQDTMDGADAEMVASFEFTPEEGWPFGDDAKVTYSVVVKSLPGEHLLYSDQGYQEGSKVDKSCAKIAKKAVKKLKAAKETK